MTADVAYTAIFIHHTVIREAMLKLFPPEIEINMYKEGFGSSDILGRKETGVKLSSLVDKIETPIVIAIQGAWGTGKTHFLKRWVGAHALENSGRAETIYFDAFESDYLDDPLIAITGAIGARLNHGKTEPILKRIKTAAYTLAQPAARVGLAVATHGATEIAGALVGEAINTSVKEINRAAEAFWKKEDGRRGAMAKLRSALTELTTTPKGVQPLVVVVDELDRCRPDYALGVLEVIKHFFTVPNVHFVLGVNMTALQNSVKARYGAGFNAEEYLRRFITLSMRLPDRVGGDEPRLVGIEYMKHAAVEMGISLEFLEVFRQHAQLIMRVNPISIRDIGRVLTHIALLNTYQNVHALAPKWKHVIASMLLMKVVAPALYEKAIASQLSTDDINDLYGTSVDIAAKANGEKYDYLSVIIHGIWDFIITGTGANEEVEKLSYALDHFGTWDAARRAPSRMARDYLDWPAL